MSKPVRLANYLYEEVARLAAAEKRSTANMVQVLLEQALKMQAQEIDDHIRLVGAVEELIEPAGTVLSEREQPTDVQTDSVGAVSASGSRSESTDDHFKPDFKKGKK